jgi:hypothetical protein
MLTEKPFVGVSTELEFWSMRHSVISKDEVDFQEYSIERFWLWYWYAYHFHCIPLWYAMANKSTHVGRTLAKMITLGFLPKTCISLNNVKMSRGPND